MGLLDNTLNNADIIDHVSAINSMVNSDPQDEGSDNSYVRKSDLKPHVDALNKLIEPLRKAL